MEETVHMKEGLREADIPHNRLTIAFNIYLDLPLGSHANICSIVLWFF